MVIDASFTGDVSQFKVPVFHHESLHELSSLETHQGILAVFSKPIPSSIQGNWNYVILDGIQDPGNLGTIVRSAVWFGGFHLILGKGCVDLFNAKTVQASAGALGMLNYSQADLTQTLVQLKSSNIQIVGLSLDVQGKNLESLSSGAPIACLVGNEGHGISNALQSFYEPVVIGGSREVESLNAGVAASIAMFHINSLRNL